MTPAPRIDPVELVTLNRISPTFGFASVRLPGVRLSGLKVELRDGGLRITPPSMLGKDGREWPCYNLQPGVREAVEQAIRDIWVRSEKPQGGDA